MPAPPTRYLESHGTHIAWQVVGDGPVDIVWVPGFISHLDLQWADRGFLRVIRRLTRFARVVLLDKAGVGLSDPVTEPRTLEAQVDDVLAVMDAAGVERPVVFGMSESGPLSVLLAAAHPHRVRSLAMLSVIVKGQADEAHPWAVTDEQWEQIDQVMDHWGEGRSIDLLAPSVAGSTVQRKVVASAERTMVSPGTAKAIAKTMRSLDLTGALPSIQIPTLVLARTREFFDIGQARFIADAIPGARLVELDGVDHMARVGDIDAWLDPLVEFVTGAEPVEVGERAFVTMLVVDVVESTSRASELGDGAWRDLLVTYTDEVHDAVADHDGRVVSTAGDGLLVVFAGPRAALGAACAIQDVARSHGLSVRAGIHAGEVELVGTDIAGLEVHVAARIGAQAADGEILVSTAARALLGAGGATTEPAGEHLLKGIPGPFALWRVLPANALWIDPQRLVRPADRALTSAGALVKRLVGVGIG